MASRRKALLIKSARQVRALRTPVRQELLQTCVRLRKCTVRDLADELGREPAALYYHVHALERAGILVRAGERRVAGRPESVYAPAAPRILIDRRVTSWPFRRALAEMQRSTLRATERELERALEAGPEAGLQPMLLRLSARLSPTSRKRAERMIRELAEFLGESDDPEADDAFALTVTFTPVRR